MGRTCLVVGQTNVGKTLFVINFADFLGAARLKLAAQDQAGSEATMTYNLNTAKNVLVNNGEHTTRALQWFNLDVNNRKGVKNFRLIDSTGITDGIHPDTSVRRGMAETLRSLAEATIILHVIDPSLKQYISQVDQEIMRLGRLRKDYAVLINKIDLGDVRLKLNEISAQLKGLTNIPISALTREGFAEVKCFVGRNI